VVGVHEGVLALCDWQLANERDIGVARELTIMKEFKIIRLDNGGFIVKDALFDNVFASTRIDEALMYVRDKMMVDPLQAQHDIEARAASDIRQQI
jgi:hypothetical protein